MPNSRRLAKAATALRVVRHGRKLNQFSTEERQTYDQQKAYLDALVQQRNSFMLADFPDRLRS